MSDKNFALEAHNILESIKWIYVNSWVDFDQNEAKAEFRQTLIFQKKNEGKDVFCDYVL